MLMSHGAVLFVLQRQGAVRRSRCCVGVVQWISVERQRAYEEATAGAKWTELVPIYQFRGKLLIIKPRGSCAVVSRCEAGRVGLDTVSHVGRRSPLSSDACTRQYREISDISIQSKYDSPGWLPGREARCARGNRRASRRKCEAIGETRRIGGVTPPHARVGQCQEGTGNRQERNGNQEQ